MAASAVPRPPRGSASHVLSCFNDWFFLCFFEVRFDEEVVTSPSPTAKMPNPSQLLEETDDYSPSTCNICGQTLSSKRNLEQHLQRHYGIYQYHCEICGKGFSSSTNLKGHQWKHTNVKEFHCPYCGMEFIYKINLKRHVQKQHPEVEGDECLADWGADRGVTSWFQHGDKFGASSSMLKNLKIILNNFNIFMCVLQLVSQNDDA